MSYNIVFLGKSIAHSILPHVYRLIGEQINQQINVKSLEINKESLPTLLRSSETFNVHAVCITFPYKIAAMDILDKSILTERALRSGSINIIKYQNKTPILSDNTDGEGFIKDAMYNKNVSFNEKNILLLGGGGTTRGIVSSLCTQNPRSITICNRNLEKLSHITNKLNSCSITTCDYTSIPKIKYDIIINATSASIKGELLPLSSDILNENVICFECAYKFKDMTPFGEYVTRLGVKAYFDGIGMLVEQAAEAIRILLNKQINTKKIIKELSS